MKIEINDQGREFVNEVSKVLHNMLGTEQCVTLAYHPQSNGHCKRQNRTIKDSLMKVLDGNPCDWTIIIKFYLRIGLANILQQNFYHSSLCIIWTLIYQSMSSTM